MALPKWLQILASIGPQVLAFTPLAPIAPAVVAGIAEAEQIPNASGTDKLTHVQNLVSTAVAAVNAQAGHQELDPNAVLAASSQAIGTVVNVVNVVHEAHAEDAAEAAAPKPAA